MSSNPYRDDLAAAHLRVHKLEQELERGAVEEEEERPRQSRASGPARPGIKAGRPGPIYYRRPHSYLPLWELFKQGLREALTRRLPPPDSSSLLTWLLHHALVVPAFHLLWRPLYLAVLLPCFALLTLIATPFVLLLVTLPGLCLVSENHPRQEGPRPCPELLKTEGGMGPFFWILILTVVTLPALAPVLFGWLGQCCSQ